MRSLFRQKSRLPCEVVRRVHDILDTLSKADWNVRDSRRDDKVLEFSKYIRELKIILYGDSDSEPVPDTCASVTHDFFREDTLCLLIKCLPHLDLETQKDCTQVVANLQRQQVNYKLIASDYLEHNPDLLDVLISGYDNMDIALHYGSMLRDCIRHQVCARHVLFSVHMRKFFDYLQLPHFDIASDAFVTFKELLTRHKSTVAEFLTANYDWFFGDFNSKLLSSDNYILKRQSTKLLGDMLLDRSNAYVMMRYVSSKDNLILLMKLLKESSKSIQIEAFHVFKLFAANQNKPPEVASILLANKSKILRFLNDFTIDKEDEHFEVDKAQVIEEIAAL